MEAETCQERLRNIYYHFLIVSRWITGLTTIHPDTEQHHPHHTGTPEDAEQTQNTHTIPKSSEAPRPSGAQSMIRGEQTRDESFQALTIKRFVFSGIRQFIDRVSKRFALNVCCHNATPCSHLSLAICVNSCWKAETVLQSIKRCGNLL